MYKYHVKIEYDGTNFVGWQFQKNGISIQQILQNSLSKLLKEKITVIGSGRTDAGVHAIEQSAHIESKKKLLGICLGMQLLFERSEEGTSFGLSFIKGDVIKFQDNNNNFKIPHMGFNSVSFNKKSKNFIKWIAMYIFENV